MSEEFIRCPECGNLNIQGSTRCVFCNNSLEKKKSEPKEETVPEMVPQTPPPSDIPSPGEVIVEEKKRTLPKIPDISVSKEETEKKEVVIEEATLIEPSFAKKFFMISIFSILIGIVHYLLNLLVSVVSVDINFDDPRKKVLPLTPDLAKDVGIRSISIVLGIFFAIFVGYAIGKIVRKYNTKKLSFIGWFCYAVVLDLILTIGITSAFIYVMHIYYLNNGYALGIFSNPNPILLLKLAGAAFIFVGVSLITLFLPMIFGSFLIFNKIDKMFFPKKYVEF